MALDYPRAPFCFSRICMPLLVSDTVTMFTCGSDGHISFQNEDTLPGRYFMSVSGKWWVWFSNIGKVFRLELVEEDKDGGWLWCWGCFRCNPQVPPDHMLTLSPQRHIGSVAKWSVLGNPYLQIGQSGNFTHRPIPRWVSRNDRLIGFRCVRVSEAAYLRLRSNFGTCLTARKTGVNDCNHIYQNESGGPNVNYMSLSFLVVTPQIRIGQGWTKLIASLASHVQVGASCLGRGRSAKPGLTTYWLCLYIYILYTYVYRLCLTRWFSAEKA